MVSRSRLRIIVTVVFGAVTALLMGMYLKELARTAPETRTIPVVVVTQSLEANSLLSEEMLQIEQFPASAAIPNMADSKAKVVGQRVIAPMVAGQPVLLHQLMPPDLDSHGRRIPRGRRLITITADELLSVGYRLRTGDRVDVFRVYQDSDGWHAVLAAQTVEVFELGVDDNGRLGTPRTVTLVVTPEEAMLLSLLEREKSLHLALRPSGDLAPIAPKPVHHLRQNSFN